MTVIGIIGIIGTVEYAHAEMFEIKFDLTSCDITQRTITHDAYTDMKKTSNITITQDDVLSIQIWHIAPYNGREKVDNVSFQHGILVDSPFIKDTEAIYTIDPPDRKKVHWYGIFSKDHRFDHKYFIFSNKVIGKHIITTEIDPNAMEYVYEKLDKKLYRDEGKKRWIQQPMIKPNCNTQLEVNVVESKESKLEFKLDKKSELKDKWKERYNTCNDKKENFKTELNNTKTELSELQLTYNATKSDYDELWIEYERSADMYYELSDKHDNLETELNQCKLDIVDKENEYIQLLNDHETQLESYKQQITNHTTTITEKQDEIDQLKQQLLEAENRIRELES